MKRVIQDKIKYPLSELLLKNKNKKISGYKVDLKEDKLTFIPL